jgi:biotin transport system substrate-specific component
MAERGRGRVPYDLLGMLLGTAAIYGLGVPWLKLVTNMGFSKALALGMYPFLLGDAVKIAVAIPLAGKLRPMLHLN